MSPEAAGADNPTAQLFFVSFSLLRPVVLFKKNITATNSGSHSLSKFSLVYGYFIVWISRLSLSKCVFFPHGGQDVLSIDGCECFI